MLLTHFGQISNWAIRASCSPQQAGSRALQQFLHKSPAQAASRGGGREMETLAGSTKKAQPGPGSLLCHPFPVCSLFVSCCPLTKGKWEHAHADRQHPFQWISS